MRPNCLRNRALRISAAIAISFATYCAVLGAWSSTRFSTALAAGCLLAFVTAVTWPLFGRPRIDLGTEGLTVTNPFSTLFVPWDEIIEVRSDRATVALDTLRDGTVWVWAAVQASNRTGRQSHSWRVADELQRRRRNADAHLS